MNRSRKRGRKLFCSASCAAKFGNVSRKAKEIEALCPCCEKRFVTTTSTKAARFCSRSCASRGSNNENRRRAALYAQRFCDGNKAAAATLRSREAWKYVALKDKLLSANRDFEFEYRINDCIFDLALLDVMVIVEFDGPDHQLPSQMKRDREKETVAKAAGFIVVRRPVQRMSVIDPETIDGL